MYSNLITNFYITLNTSYLFIFVNSIGFRFYLFSCTLTSELACRKRSRLFKNYQAEILPIGFFPNALNHVYGFSIKPKLLLILEKKVTSELVIHCRRLYEILTRV